MKLFKEVFVKHKRMICFYIVLGVIVSFLSVFSINYLQTILDLFVAEKLKLSNVIFYGIVLVVTALLSYLDTYPEQKLMHGLYLDFKLQALKKMKTIDYLEYSKLGTGIVSQRVDDGAEASRDVYMNFWFKTFRSLVPMAIISLFFIGMINWIVLLLVVFGYVVVIVISSLLLRKLYSVKESILVNSELLNKRLIRSFMEMVVFRTNKKYNSEIKLTQDGIKNVVDNKTKIRMVHELFFMIFEILVNLIQIGVVVYALITKDVSVGGVVAIITLLPKAYQPISIFNVEFIDYKLNKVAVNRFKEFLSLPDTENLLENGTKLNLIEGNIELKNVSFAYDKKQVLESISLNIKKGEKVAFVGESGSGKSTIIKLIAGLISAQKGMVKVDDINIKGVNLNSYYDYLSYLSQESPIFDGTLRENIFVNKNATDEEIFKVLKNVCLDEFVKKLPDGLDTPMGEKGILVSGGERQRIAMARLFFDESKIVILDEATSAMDNITESKVMKNIYNKLTEKTIIIVAHRLSTIKNVDNIFVLKSGQIVASGKFDNLMQESEYFSQLNLKNKKEQ